MGKLIAGFLVRKRNKCLLMPVQKKRYVVCLVLFSDAVYFMNIVIFVTMAYGGDRSDGV